MTCQDDANFIGDVSLFCGVETAKWSDQQFTSIAQFAKQQGIKTLLIKVSEVGSGAGDLWYGGLPGIDHIKSLIEAQEVQFIPYTFPVGPYIDLVSNIQKSIDIAVQLLQRYNVVCLDVEGGPWSGSAGATAAQAMAKSLVSIPGRLWLSMPADFASNNMSATFQAFSQCTNVWMPMCYNDNLTGVYLQQIKQVNSGACIQPTLDLSQEFGANNVFSNAQKIKSDGCLAISLWYEQFAQQNVPLVSQIVQLFGGSSTPQQPNGGQPLKTDSTGDLIIVPKSFQLETEQLANIPGSPQGTKESPDLCGPWAAYAVSEGVPPGQTPKDTQESLDQYIDNMVDKLFGPGGFNHINFEGVLPDDMIKILNFIRDDRHTIHYQVVAPTIDNIHRAHNAGYPVLFSCNEADITAWNKSKSTWEHAYPWQLSAGHVLPSAGYEHSTGNLYSPDQLNDNYQGYWPVIYRASDIAKSLSWLCVIQLVGPDANNPWLAAIPGSDPTTWPANFNAQLFAGGVPPSPSTPPAASDNKFTAFSQEWGPNPQSGIAKAAYATYWTSNFAGGQITGEFDLLGKDGKTYTAQRVHMGIWLWDRTTGTAHYYPYHAG